MSKQIDFTKVKNCVIDTIRVGEMWFRGIMIYPKKQAPTLDISCAKGTNNIVITAQFNDYVHRYRYFDEVSFSSTQPETHGILYIRKSDLGLKAFNVGTPGVVKKFSAEYDDDGKFKAYIPTTNSTTKKTVYVMMAFIKVKNPDTGEKDFIYSKSINASYNSFL